jgi:hypothetical protein
MPAAGEHCCVARRPHTPLRATTDLVLLKIPAPDGPFFIELRRATSSATQRATMELLAALNPSGRFDAAPRSRFRTAFPEPSAPLMEILRRADAPRDTMPTNRDVSAAG